MYSQNNFFEIPESSNSSPAARDASFKGKPGKKWHQRWWGKLILAFVLLLLSMLVAMGFYVFKLFSAISADPPGNPASTAELELAQVLASTDDPRFGPADAKVVIVEFSDFQCPFCQQAVPVVKQLEKDYGDQLLFIYRDFPLTSIHPQALLGAMGGACAHEQGGFWPMHDLIFANQENITVENLKRWSVQVGLNSLQFSNCLDVGKYLPEIEEDLQAGYAAGVRATPTFFINGRRIEGAVPYSQLEQIILTELTK